MGLDMTGEARFNPGVHYRRYLATDGRIAVICVQDFDYRDYDASRFLDTQTFETDEEAHQVLIDLTEMIIAASDREGAVQVLRNIRAVREHLIREAEGLQ